MKTDVLMRMVDRRLRYKVLLEERIRQLEAVLEKAPDSVNYVGIAGEVEDLWQRGSGNWKHTGWLLRRALGTCRARGEGTTRPMSERGGTRAYDDR